MSGLRKKLERNVKAEVEAAIGAEPDLLLLRNTVGSVKYYDGKGQERFVTYGLGTGSPDLVGLLMTKHGHAAWFCLELKAVGGGDVSEEQTATVVTWIKFGALVYVVRSAEEARAALAHARRTVAA